MIKSTVQIEYLAKGMKLANQDITSFEKVNKTLANTIQNSVTANTKKLGIALGETGSIIGTKVISQFDKMGKNSGQFSKINTYFKDINGTLLQQEQILKRVNAQTRVPTGRGGQTVFGKKADGFEVVSSGPIRTVSADKIFGPQQKSIFSEIDVGKLAARAALTIPTWLALRAGIMGVIDIIPNAVDRFKELDSAAAEMKVLTDGAANIDNFSATASAALLRLSKELGTSITDLKNIYTAISSTGIDAATSFSAMETVAKGSIATGADAKLLATTMAGLVNTMGDTLEVGKTKSEQFQVLMVLLHKAMKTNAGNMNDFSEALGQAGSSAATSGMKLSELIANVAVLQTAMVKAGMGGTALRTSLDQVVQKRQEIANLFKKDITPEQNKNQFTLIQDVVKAIQGVADTQGLEKANEWMMTIFGVKASKNVNVLRQNLEKFTSTFSQMQELLKKGDYAGISAMQDELLADLDERLKTAERQQMRLGQIFGEGMRQLVANAFGFSDEEGKDAFKQFVDSIEKAQPVFENVGKSINMFGKALMALMTLAFWAAFPVAAVTIANSADLIALRFSMTANIVVASSKKMMLAMTALMTNPAFLAVMAVMGVGAGIKAIVDTNKKVSTANAYVPNKVEELASTGMKFEDIKKKIISEANNDTVTVGMFGTDIRTKELLNKSVREAYERGLLAYAKKATQAPVVTGKIDVVKTTTEETKKLALTEEQLFKREMLALESLKRYGITSIQIKEQELALIEKRYVGEERNKKLIEAQLELDKRRLDKQLAYYSSLQSSIKDSLLGNLQGKGNNLFSDMGANFTSQLQTSMSENLSNVIMSSGVGDVFAGAMGFLDEGAKRITDPVIAAHVEGGQKVHDFIIKAWDKITGKQTASGGGGIGTAGFSGSGTGLPGIWGSSTFTNYSNNNLSVKSQGANISNTAPKGVPKATGATPNFWGKAGAAGTIGVGTAVTAASGIQQMSGGGAKNIVGGLGTVGMSLGAGAVALSAAGMGALGASAATLGVVGPIGLAIGAVLMIASMFMKGAKSTQTSTQTSETKVGSKIDISNKRLELINRNLIALKNTMETYALSTSSYFAEKNGTIDSQFALSARRSYA